MYVYFITSNSEPPAVKVGKSNQPDARLANLQVSSPHKLDLIGKVLCWTEERALQFEADIHSELLPHRMTGEWFSWNAEVQARIGELMLKTFPRPAPLHRKKRKPVAAAAPQNDDLPGVPIPLVAERHGIDVKRLRGAVWTENQNHAGHRDLPIGDAKLDRVQDDEALRRWIARQVAA